MNDVEEEEDELTFIYASFSAVVSFHCLPTSHRIQILLFKMGKFYIRFCWETVSFQDATAGKTQCVRGKRKRQKERANGGFETGVSTVWQWCLLRIKKCFIWLNSIKFIYCRYAWQITCGEEAHGLFLFIFLSFFGKF